MDFDFYTMPELELRKTKRKDFDSFEVPRTVMAAMRKMKLNFAIGADSMPRRPSKCLGSRLRDGNAYSGLSRWVYVEQNGEKQFAEPRPAIRMELGKFFLVLCRVEKDDSLPLGGRLGILECSCEVWLKACGIEMQCESQKSGELGDHEGRVQIVFR